MLLVIQVADAADDQPVTAQRGLGDLRDPVRGVVDGGPRGLRMAAIARRTGLVWRTVIEYRLLWARSRPIVVVGASSSRARLVRRCREFPLTATGPI